MMAGYVCVWCTCAHDKVSSIHESQQQAAPGLFAKFKLWLQGEKAKSREAGHGRSDYCDGKGNNTDNADGNGDDIGETENLQRHGTGANLQFVREFNNRL